MQRPSIIIIGNQKGGTGKSTVSIHIIAYFLKHGFKVGSIDLDASQGTLSKYIRNRQNNRLPVSDHIIMPKVNAITITELENKEQATFESMLARLWYNDILIIDTPGSDNFLSRLAHSFADVLVTPINDSFLDLDLLVRIKDERLHPSVYAEMVWEQRKRKMHRDKSSLEWIVLRNRLSSLYSHNTNKVYTILSNLSKRIGFKTCDGLGERVIFREMFESGKTLFDLPDDTIDVSSHKSAKHEIETLVFAINKCLPLYQTTCKTSIG